MNRPTCWELASRESLLFIELRRAAPVVRLSLEVKLPHFRRLMLPLGLWGLLMRDCFQIKTSEVLKTSEVCRVLLVGLLATAVFPVVALAQFGPAKVSVTEVIERKDVASGRVFVGTVEARRHSSIGSAVSGRVVEFLVNEGDRVAAKQPLARLLTKNLEIQIAAAKAELKLREEELLELKNGTRVEERSEAEARMNAAESAMKFAKARLARTKGLVQRNATTTEQIDEDTSLSETAAASYLAAKAANDLAIAGPRKERIAQAAARASVAEEEVNRLLDILEKHTITAPFAGYVVAEHTEVGQWIESGKLVAEIVEVDPIEVRVNVQESYVPRLLIGMSARIDVDALPEQTFVGTVSAIVPKGDEKSRTFPVRITLSNSKQADGTPVLKPGMFAKVELPVDQKKVVMLVPKDSLVLGREQPLVYVVDKKSEKQIARLVSVQLGIAAGAWIEVRGELEPGQQVIVEGNERLRPDTEIIPVPAEIKPPALNSSASISKKDATN